MSDGGFTSIDNTRIRAARATGTPVEAHIRFEKDPLPSSKDVERFKTKRHTPSTWGDAVLLRIDKQGATFKDRNPYGSSDPPRVTGAPESWKDQS